MDDIHKGVPDWIPVVSYLVNILGVPLASLIGALALYFAAKAKALGETNKHKIDMAAEKAQSADEKATIIASKIDVNTAITKDGVDKLDQVHTQINGRMDELIQKAKSEGVLEGIKKASESGEHHFQKRS